jgi:hypothetical protein
MFSKIVFAIAILAASPLLYSQTSLSPFGSKPIQIGIGEDGKLEQKKSGFICDLTASLGSAHYSEWGETEKDAQTIVLKKCQDKSGLLICKRDKITCRVDK